MRRDTGAEGDYVFGPLHVQPRARLLKNATERVTVEPLVMQLLVLLSRRPEQVITRSELFAACWGAAAVGDDSLNRVVASLRRSLAALAGDDLVIETVPGCGYVLRLNGEARQQLQSTKKERAASALQSGRDSWRLGLPKVDLPAIEGLREACIDNPGDAALWGMRALLCRHAVEYGTVADRVAYIAECEASAREALGLDPTQPEALAALAGLLPLVGAWADCRDRLLAILDIHPDNPVALQDLATLEMSTGRVREGKRIRDGLIATDPLAAVSCYKSIFQHWSIGDHAGMDRVATRAMALWPSHPAVWNVRLWTYAYTDRTQAALAMIADDEARPAVPPPMLGFLGQVLRCDAQAGDEAAGKIKALALSFASTGPAAALAAMFALGLRQQVDALLALANAYYFEEGSAPVPSHHSEAELALNENHRRLSQILFTPVFRQARADPRFDHLCRRLGLADYWERTGLRPDFMALNGGPTA